MQYKSSPKTDFYFFDESRFGTHSKIGHAWFKKGNRPLVKVKLGFENFYVYSAVNSCNGKDFSLIMPKLNTKCMNIFLEEFSKAHKDKEVVFVMDGAAWHKSQSLVVHKNITIIILPPYSPELNPVERLWLYMKNKFIKNRIYDSIEELYEAVDNFFIHINQEIIKNICSAQYLVR